MSTTIQQVIDILRESVPVELPVSTVDTFKCGDPSRPVSGIVTTFIATVEVIRKAAALGANLIVTHEPTYFNHRDKTAWLKKDPLYKAKRKLLDENGIAVWRFHDGWHSVNPDGILTGVVQQLGWQAYQDAQQPYFFHLPRRSLGALVTEIKKRMGSRVLRVVGKEGSICGNVAFMPGSDSGEHQVQVLGIPEVEVLLCGEAPEWQTAEYVRDALAFDQNKALIVLGHEPSEEAGMAYLAEWLKARFTDVPVTHVPAGEPLSLR
jgi:putative NIF3 family GTP cyclohydrolase 1 type 2